MLAVPGHVDVMTRCLEDSPQEVLIGRIIFDEKYSGHDATIERSRRRRRGRPRPPGRLADEVESVKIDPLG